MGVVTDFKIISLDRKPVPEIFWCLRQASPANVWILTRGKSDSAALGETLRRKIQDVDPELPVQEMQPMQDVIADSLLLKRVSASLIGLGLVTGLKGTGDGGKYLPMINALGAALAALNNPASGPTELKDAANVALVLIEATVPAHGIHRGQRLDQERGEEQCTQRQQPAEQCTANGGAEIGELVESIGARKA